MKMLRVEKVERICALT